jgi:hypothetical protein
MSLQNRCDFAVESTVSWQLVCGESNSGAPIERVERLAASSERVIVASVDACGPSPYRIDGLRWSWRPEPVTAP